LNPLPTSKECRKSIAEMKAAVRVGITTAELDAVAASTFKRFGAVMCPDHCGGDS
jgi:hypothetical protein